TAACRARSRRRDDGRGSVMSYYGFRPYVPVAKRRAIAARELEKLRKKGRKITPVVIEGRTIARTFWGKAWCENLERFRLRESPAARPNLCAQWFSRRSADRARSSPGDGGRVGTLHG